MSAPITARWYCVDRVGVATLCVDEDDAVRSVAELGAMYPKRRPYIAVLLGDVAAERERCARLAELRGKLELAQLIRKGDAA